MSLLKTLRKLGGPLMAALLVLAVLTPTIDMYACANDKAPAMVVASVSFAKAADQKSSNIPLQQHDDGDSGCIHGHCHHGIGVAKLNEGEVVSEASPSSMVSPWTFDAPASAPSVDLLRPPRA